MIAHGIQEANTTKEETVQSIHWFRGRYSGHHRANQLPLPTQQESLKPLERKRNKRSKDREIRSNQALEKSTTYCMKSL